MPWEREDVTLATQDAKDEADAIRRVLTRYDGDVDQRRRLAMHLCSTCHYLRERIGGRAMTEYQCRGCGKTAMHSSTCVPKLCPVCAKVRQLCQHCGGSM